MTKQKRGTGATSVKPAVRKRDGYRCTKCGLTNAQSKAQFHRQLDVHRVTPGSPYTVEGCITVCRNCHGPLPRRERNRPDLAKGIVVPCQESLVNRIADLAERHGLTAPDLVRMLLVLHLPEYELKDRLGLSLLAEPPSSGKARKREASA